MVVLSIVRRCCFEVSFKYCGENGTRKGLQNMPKGVDQWTFYTNQFNRSCTKYNHQGEIEELRAGDGKLEMSCCLAFVCFLPGSVNN